MGKNLDNFDPKIYFLTEKIIAYILVHKTAFQANFLFPKSQEMCKKVKKCNKMVKTQIGTKYLSKNDMGVNPGLILRILER